MGEAMAYLEPRAVGIPARAQHGAKPSASTRLGVPARAGAAEHAGRVAVCAWGASRDEPASDAARARFLRDHPAESREIEAAEQKRRDRKAAKAGEDDAGPLFERNEGDEADADA